MKIPMKVRLKKVFASLFDWLGEIDLNIFTGVFLALFLIGLGFDNVSAFIIGIFGYFLYIRIEETLLKHARILSKKK